MDNAERPLSKGVTGNKRLFVPGTIPIEETVSLERVRRACLSKWLSIVLVTARIITLSKHFSLEVDVNQLSSGFLCSSVSHISSKAACHVITDLELLIIIDAVMILDRFGRLLVV